MYTFVKHDVVTAGSIVSLPYATELHCLVPNPLWKLCGAIIVNGNEMLHGEGITDYYVLINVMTLKYYCEYSGSPAIYTIVVVI